MTEQEVNDAIYGGMCEECGGAGTSSIAVVERDVGRIADKIAELFHLTLTDTAAGGLVRREWICCDPCQKRWSFRWDLRVNDVEAISPPDYATPRLRYRVISGEPPKWVYTLARQLGLIASDAGDAEEGREETQV
jgi:hypothetical protein